MKITITTEYIQLQQALKFAGLVGTGAEAKMVIQDGLVTVNDEVETRRGKKLRPGDFFEYDGQRVEIDGLIPLPDTHNSEENLLETL
jgi:ribosome-associated protein